MGYVSEFYTSNEPWSRSTGNQSSSLSTLTADWQRQTAMPRDFSRTLHEIHLKGKIMVTDHVVQLRTNHHAVRPYCARQGDVNTKNGYSPWPVSWPRSAWWSWPAPRGSRCQGSGTWRRRSQARGAVLGWRSCGDVGGRGWDTCRCWGRGLGQGMRWLVPAAKTRKRRTRGTRRQDWPPQTWSSWRLLLDLHTEYTSAIDTPSLV